MKIGEHKIGSAEEFVRLRLSDNREEYLRAAYSWAEDAVWHEVLARFPEMAHWVIHNKSVPTAILQHLIDTDDAETRREVTRKRKLTPAQIEQLSKDPDPGVRQGVARHPKISEDLLLALQKIQTTGSDAGRIRRW